MYMRPHVDKQVESDVQDAHGSTTGLRPLINTLSLAGERSSVLLLLWKARCIPRREQLHQELRTLVFLPISTRAATK